MSAPQPASAAPGELWRAVPSAAPGLEVSSHGAVRKHGRVLKPELTGRGYHRIDAKLLDGSRRKLRVSRLVAEAFLGPAPTAAHQVDHIDGNKVRNTVANLRWLTASDNVRASYANGHSRARTARPVARLHGVDGSLIDTFDSVTVAALAIGRSRASIQQAVANRTSCAGFRWCHVGDLRLHGPM